MVDSMQTIERRLSLWRVHLTEWFRSKRRQWIYVALLICSLRVIFWLPVGYSPDNANSFSPVMPLVTSPLSSFTPWLNGTDGGYLNPSVPHAIDSLPQLVFSSLGLSTWGAQVGWLFLLYLVGSVLAAEAFLRVFPRCSSAWPIVALCGIAYQLSPSLIYGLQDTAAYGLPISFYWGIPLLVLLGVDLIGSRWRQAGFLFGLASLLFFAEFPSSLALVPAMILLLGGIVLDRARSSRIGWKALTLRSGYFLSWICLFNAWWFVTEFQYRNILLSTLQTSTPSTAVQPNHVFYLLSLNWDWPQISQVIPYQGVGVSLFAGLAVGIITFGAILGFRKDLSGLTIYVVWLLLFIPLYGYSQPLGPFYVSFLHQSFILNLIRNPTRFDFLFAFLFACVFASGVSAVLTFVSKLESRVDQMSPGLPRWRFGRRKHPRAISAVVVLVAVALLVTASYPLVNGDVVENTTYNGSAVLPTIPPSHGVKVPSYYSAASAWLSANFPATPKMILPMPGTWLSAQSRLSWGYEGGAAIYETLLPPPIIMNQAGTLTQPAFPAIASVYQYAATGGVPGFPARTSMNGSIGLWPGYVGDSVTKGTTGGSSTPDLLTWTVNLSQDFGPNGHIFSQAITNLPGNASYFGFWISAPTEGALYFSWGINGTFVGWYPIVLSNSSAQFVLIPAASPPPINYRPSFPANGFVNATEIEFSYIPEGPVQSRSISVTITNYTTYPKDTAGLVYLLQSLGVGLVVTDSSIVASSADSLQNLSNYDELLQDLSPFYLHTFGNLTVYKVPFAPGLVSSPAQLSHVSSYTLAWAERNSSLPYFVINAPQWLRTTFTSADLSVADATSTEVRVSGTCDSQCVVVLMQNYNSLWQAVSTSSVSTFHFEINGWANAWLVNASGRFQLDLEIPLANSMIEVVILSVVSGLALLLVPALWTALRSGGGKSSRNYATKE